MQLLRKSAQDRDYKHERMFGRVKDAWQMIGTVFRILHCKIRIFERLYDENTIFLP